MKDVEKEVTMENYHKYYGYTFYCRNCGDQQYRQIEKGKTLDTVAFECSNCGCTVKGRRI